MKKRRGGDASSLVLLGGTTIFAGDFLICHVRSIVFYLQHKHLESMGRGHGIEEAYC